MTPSAGWYPDPVGRHEHRYWDGDRWTEHVSDGGTTATDPVDAPAESGSSAELEPTAGGSGGGLAPPQPDQGASRQTAGGPGWQTSSTPTTTGGPTTNGMAIASLVVAIALGWIPVLGNIAAVILGVIARRQIRDSGGRQSGDGLALAGIVLGAIGLLLWIAAAVFLGTFVTTFSSEITEISESFTEFPQQ